MATKVNINGKLVTRPGVYTQTKSGIQNAPARLDYGTVTIFDDGIGAGWGAGKGSTPYTFETIQDFRDFVKGGPLWDLGQPLFKPIPLETIQGASKVILIQGRETTSAVILNEFTNGVVTITTKDEGLNANGEELNDILIQGYGGVFKRINVPTSSVTFVTTQTQAADAGTAETRATGVAYVFDLGVDADIFRVYVGTNTLIASFTKTSTETTTTAIAAALVVEINNGTGTHGYTATNTANRLNISAPVGSGSTPNGTNLTLSHYYYVSDNFDSQGTQFSGGSNGTAAQPKKTKAVAANIQVGDVFTLIQGTVTIEKTAITRNPLDLYYAFAVEINTNSTTSAAVTATYDINGLVLTGDNNSSFSQSTSAVAGPPQFIYQLWHGTFKGIDPVNNVAYDGVPAAIAKPVLLAESPILRTLTDLKNWLTTDVNVTNGFTATVEITGTDELTINDANDYAGNNLAEGGTEDYSSAALQTSLTKLKEADTNFYLSTRFGTDATHENNDTILSEVINTGKYERFLWIAGGDTNSELVSISAAAADHYDNDKVTISHGGALVSIRNNAFKKKTQLWKMASVLGRLCGLTPQTPLTLKRVGFDTDAYPLDETEQEYALAHGILVTYNDTELVNEVVLQGINSLQTNDNLVNDDGTSFSIAVRRITAQLNKEIALYLKKKFFGNDFVGPNRNTVTEDDLKAAVEGYLQNRIASTNNDDLIISFRNISVVIDQDVYRVNYEFVPNYEINKFIVTGIILDK